MWGLISRLVLWDLTRKKARLLLMVLALFGTLTTYVLLGAVFDDIIARTMLIWRQGPYDLVVTKAPEDGALLNDIRGINGIIRADAARSLPVLAGVQETQLLSLDRGALLVRNVVEGVLPERADEIAVPLPWSEHFSIKIGDEITILPIVRGAEAKAFIVSGFLAASVQQVVVSPLGMESFSQADPILYITLDGEVKLDAIKNEIWKLTPSSQVNTIGDHYGGVQVGVIIANGLSSIMRFLILVIVVSSMGVLTYLTQREQAYQSGVLRAMGFSAGWLLVAPLTEGLLVYSVGGILSFMVTAFFSKSLGLLSGGITTLGEFFGHAGFFIIFGLGVIAISSRSFAQRPIPDLLRDIWGK